MPRKSAGSHAGDYSIGWGRPPTSTRWKPGQSGNSKGRSKGTKNLITALEETLNAKVKVHDRGKVRRMTALEAIVKRLVHDALKGDHKAISVVLGYEPELAREIASRAHTFNDMAEFPENDADATARAAATYFKMIRGGRS